VIPHPQHTLAVLLVAAALAGCLAPPGGAPAPQRSPTAPAPTGPPVQRSAAVEPLPDLVVESIRVSMAGYTGGCVAAYAPIATTVCVRNRGQADAGGFTLALGGHTWRITGLPVDAVECRSLTGGYGRADADTLAEIAEADEANNALEIHVPTLTPPALCTVTPSPAP